MKLISKLLLGVAFVFFFGSVSAQQTSQTSSTDSQVMLQVIEQTTPTPAESLPRVGTFYSAQHAPGSLAAWPPLPGNMLGLDAWSLGDGVFLLNDTDIDYAALQAESALEMSFAPSMNMMSMSSFVGADFGLRPYLTNLVVTSSNNSTIASFSIAGGTNYVPYDIWMTTNLTDGFSQETWLGIGYSSNRYTFSNQPKDIAFYALALPQKTTTVAFGLDDIGQCDVPFGLTNAVMVAGGGGQSLALKTDKTLIAWGADYYGEGSVPTNLAGVSMITAGWYHNVALLTNGTVTAWGFNLPALGYFLTNVPANLTNAVVISAQALHTLALRKNGTVVSWGYNSSYGETNVPTGLSNVVAISAGYQHNLAAKADGTVVAWGGNYYGQCNVPSGLSNVVDVAAGAFHSLALLNNGTVVAWGDNFLGETDIPAGLSNVVAIAAGGDPTEDASYSIALKKDGTIVTWGYDEAATPLDGLTHVIAIGAGADHALAIRSGPPSPVITHEPEDKYQLTGSNVIFSAQGAGLYGVTYQWQFNGVNISGATNSALMLTNAQTSQQGNYRVIISDNYGSITSSVAAFAIVTPPVITAKTLPTNQLVMVYANVTFSVLANAPGQLNGFPISYQWKLNGTPITFANSSNYIFSADQSGTYSVTITNAAGSTNVSWNVTVLYPGSVWSWGENDDGESDAPAITNFSAIAAGEYHSVGVKDDGSIVQWGYDWADIPANLTNAISVAAGYEHTVALRSDGTVAVWGYSNSVANVATNLSGVKAVACGWDHNVALLTNGIVVAWGFNGGAFGWNLLQVPAGLTNATAISAASLHSLALRSNGTVVAWGYDGFGEASVPSGLSNVVAIAAGDEHNLALKSDGTVVAWGYNGSGQCNVPAGMSNVLAIAAGYEHSVALKNDGTIVSWGNNSDGQTNVPTLFTNLQSKLIAAGGNHTIAALFSPLVQYPVDVTKDLLLIYNTNSADSETVMNYYLQHRPLVSGANVVGIGYTNSTSPGYYETISPTDLTNLILSPVASWLTANPTKRPEYVILFLDVPSRVYYNTIYPTNGNYPRGDIEYPSVSVHLQSVSVGWQPLATHINMDGTNDCIAYIDKLAAFQTNYSPNQLIIGANAAGYSNTNYYLAYLAGFTNVGFNIAGYFSGGVHAGLGNAYALDGKVRWSGASSWWLIHTAESFNGLRVNPGQGTFMQWYANTAFGGTNYSSTPIGAVTSIDEPGAPGSNLPIPYFALWESGKNFAICAWGSRKGPEMQAVGDPFVRK